MPLPAPPLSQTSGPWNAGHVQGIAVEAGEQAGQLHLRCGDSLGHGVDVGRPER